MVLPAALAVVAAPPLLAWLLPDYQTGLAPLVWLVPGVLALVLALPGSQYLVAVGRQRRALAAVVVATAAAAFGNHLALRGGYGLTGVAQATAVAYLVYFALVTGVSIWIELGTGDRFRYVAVLTLALVPTLGSAFLMRHLATTTVAEKIAAVTIVWTLTVILGWRLGRWRK